MTEAQVVTDQDDPIVCGEALVILDTRRWANRIRLRDIGDRIDRCESWVSRAMKGQRTLRKSQADIIWDLIHKAEARK